ncbi:MAG: metallophosphoesterase [Candidatus Kapabacteria bacterium]|nr:metallophosphoesterase [Candidatus Kapabacteria bacterium]
MPNASSFLIAALCGYFILVVLLTLGALHLRRVSRKVILSRSATFTAIIVILCSQLPFVYYLFFYKSLRLALPVGLWFWMWVLGFAVTGALLAVVGWSGIQKVWRLMYAPKKKNNNVASGEQLRTDRREFMSTSAFAGIGAIVSSRTFITHDHEVPLIERVDFAIPRLPIAFDGVRVAVYSDIHASPFMLRNDIARHKVMIESEKPDIILLPGDFINNRTDEVFECCEALAGIHAPLGVYAVTGNHDYFSQDVERVTALLEQCGIRFLRNGNTRIHTGGTSIQLLGIDDPFINSVGKYVVDGFTHEKELENMLRGIDTQLCSILLCHRPYRFPEFSRIGMDAMIAGHTHGGQIVLGELAGRQLSFSGMSSPYIAGKYIADDKRSVLYVTRGVGSVGIPLRLNAPPEITLLTLRTQRTES